MNRLHVLNGGFGNSDRDLLNRKARTDRRVESWVVPKGARIGDEVVINIAGEGFYAVGRIASSPRPRRNWYRRYGADVAGVTLITPPLSIERLKKLLPRFKWLRYPRSITTPREGIAEGIRALVWTATKGSPEDRELVDAGSSQKVQRLVVNWTRSQTVRKAVLRRARGICEGCENPAPFLRIDGSAYLETHHVQGVAKRGKDSAANVIALCPNCHCRAEHSQDATAYNKSLRKKLEKILAQRKPA